MNRKILAPVIVLLMTILLCASAAPPEDGPAAAEKTLSIASVDNRPIFTDKLLYTAFKETDHKITITTAASLQVGYSLANNGERDGVISSTPDMRRLYPNLKQVPVILERNNNLAFIRDGDNLQLNGWSDLAGLKVGILTQRVYIQSKIPPGAVIMAKETEKLLFEGLLRGEYDVAVCSQREHEISNLPQGLVRAGQMDFVPEYLYLHKKHEKLIPVIERELLSLFENGQAEKILKNIPMPELYHKKTILHIISSSIDSSRQDMFDTRLRAPFQNNASLEWLTIGLDSTRFSDDPTRLAYFANILRQDCIAKNIAAIIVSDEDALSFLKDYYFRFFKKTPVLFCGLGDNYAEQIQGYERYFTGLVETISAFDTVSMALKIFPETKHIYVVNDYTSQGIRYRKSIENQLKPFSDTVYIEYSENTNASSLMENIMLLPENSLIFIGSYFRDRNGQYFSANELKRLLELNSKSPIISLYSAEAMYNSLGGKCLDYGKHGEVIAGMLKRLLDGEDVSNIPVITDSADYNRWIFDQTIMDKFSIEASSLPKGAFIVNKKPTIWEANPFLAFGMATLLVLSVGFGLSTQYYSYRENIRRKEEEARQLRYAEKLRQAAFKAEEASRMKSVFLANMSHEIRTPLNSIIGFSELAFDDDLPPKTRKYLENITVNSTGLLQIINDILDISKIESGKIELETIPFDMHEVFSFCKTIVTPKALEKNLSLFFYAEPPLEKKLLGDPNRLRQVLLNLVSNAVKFTNSGVIKVLSSFTEAGNDDIIVHVEIKDSGIGMSEAQIKKIFEPFVQADESTTRKYGGTGLGLSITKNIIELMGGKLNVESVPDIGSKFSFDLLFKTIDSKDVAFFDESSLSEIKKPFFSGEVLVCEDNAMNQNVVREHLERVGLDSVIADNGSQGIELVKSRMEKGEKPFDLIFMDIHMPVMDGLEAAKNLTAIGNKTPIVALTANVMLNDREIYRQHGMADHLAKPFTSQTMWRCLSKHLTPLELKTVGKNEQAAADEKLRQKLLVNFAKDNQSTFEEIAAAVETGDIKLAYRLVHTLKGVAGLIGRSELQEAAKVVEYSLQNEQAHLRPEDMNTLKFELNAALEELSPLLSQLRSHPKPAHESPLDKAKFIEIADNLEPFLKTNNAECLDLLDELAAIPGTESLIEQIENYDFAQARKTLAIIRQSLEEGEI